MPKGYHKFLQLCISALQTTLHRIPSRAAHLKLRSSKLFRFQARIRVKPFVSTSVLYGAALLLTATAEGPECRASFKFLESMANRTLPTRFPGTLRAQTWSWGRGQAARLPLRAQNHQSPPALTSPHFNPSRVRTAQEQVAQAHLHLLQGSRFGALVAASDWLARLFGSWCLRLNCGRTWVILLQHVAISSLRDEDS